MAMTCWGEDVEVMTSCDMQRYENRIEDRVLLK